MGKQVGTFVVSIVASLGTRNKRGGWRCLRVNALTPGPSPCRVVCGRGLLVGLGEGGLSMAFGAGCGGKGSMELALVCPRSHAPRGNAVWTLCVRPHPRPLSLPGRLWAGSVGRAGRGESSMAFGDASDRTGVDDEKTNRRRTPSSPSAKIAIRRTVAEAGRGGGDAPMRLTPSTPRGW